MCPARPPRPRSAPPAPRPSASTDGQPRRPGAGTAPDPRSRPPGAPSDFDDGLVDRDPVVVDDGGGGEHLPVVGEHELHADDGAETYEVVDALVGVVTVHRDDPAVLSRHPTLLRVGTPPTQQREEPHRRADRTVVKVKKSPHAGKSRISGRSSEPTPDFRHRTVWTGPSTGLAISRRDLMRMLIAAGALALGTTALP